MIAQRTMHKAPRDAERSARAFQKRRDASALLTILGVIMFASPLISAFGTGTGQSAVPLAVQYVFNTWAALICGAFVVSRALSRPEAGTTQQQTETNDI